MAGIKVEGLADLKKAFEHAAKMGEVKEAVRSSGAELQRAMQRKAESTFNKGYATGATKRSVSLDLSGSGFTATVSPGTNYSPYLEYGTRFMEAEPFVKPALNEVEPKFIQAIEKLVR